VLCSNVKVIILCVRLAASSGETVVLTSMLVLLWEYSLVGHFHKEAVDKSSVCLSVCLFLCDNMQV